MDLALLLLTLGIGIAVAAPIGPINLIVMRTALERGFIPGVAAGLGSVIGDAFFGGIAAYGIRAVEALVQSYAKGLGMLGGGLLVIVGVMLARSHIDVETIRSGSQTISKRRIAETLFLTLTNPASLFGMLALFSGLGPALNLASTQHIRCRCRYWPSGSCLAHRARLSALAASHRRHKPILCVGLICLPCLNHNRMVSG